MSRKFMRLAYAAVLSGALVCSPITAFAASESVSIAGVEKTFVATKNVQAAAESKAQPTEKAEQKVKVMVFLKNQPLGLGNKGNNLAQVRNVANEVAKIKDVEISREFGLLAKGFSAWVYPSQISQIQAIPQVEYVRKAKVFYPLDEGQRELTGVANAIKAQGDLDGRGTVVSIIDSGIDMAHPDMTISPEAKAVQKIAPKPGFTDKVPYGWNFADNNSDLKDTGSMHGMHVAGIVAANGAESCATVGKCVRGAAPGAQLLAMKVFSNDQRHGGAYEDILIQAIEKSVELGADVINMSLGSDNGTDMDEQGSARAIKNARAAGVQVVVAAGNEGISTALRGDEVNTLGTLDSGSLGSPSSAPDAFSVASIDNAWSMSTIGEAKWDGGQSTPAYDQQAPVDKEGNVVAVNPATEYEIAYCGKGGPSTEADSTYKTDDFAAPPCKDLTGKFALIQRGEIAFSMKAENAKKHGATGVVIFNADGDDSIMGMAGLDKVDIPVIGMGNSDGKTLAEQLKAGKSVKIKFTGQKKTNFDEKKVKPSSFTSWGATPDLQFKPQIAGVGGGVYSTLNNGKHGNMSGTSMATPNVAGLSALLVQHFKKNFPAIKGAELEDHMQIVLSNTARIIESESGVPFSTRQMGAGLADVSKAVKTRVLATATFNGSKAAPNVALKQVPQGSTQAVTVTLKNIGDKTYNFNTGQSCGVNEIYGTKDKPAVTKTACNNAETASASAPSVSVAPGQTATVTWNIPISAKNAADQNVSHWVMGWLKLASADSEQPDLAVPYMGVASDGKNDWITEPIIDLPGDQATKDKPAVLTDVFGDKAPTGHINSAMELFGHPIPAPLTGKSIYISPNGDNFYDVVFPSVAFLRSASEVTFQILDKDNKVLVELGKERDIQHLSFAKLGANLGAAINSFDSNKWNGKIWDKAKGEFVTVPDGMYKYRMVASLSDNFKNVQTVDMPFGVDTKKPTVTFENKLNADGSADVKFTLKDEGSGVDMDYLTVNDAIGTHYGADKKVIDEAAGTVVVHVKDYKASKYLSIMVTDRAFNNVYDYDLLDPAIKLQITDANMGKVVNERNFDDSPYNTDVLLPFLRKDGTFPVRGAYAEGITKVTVNGKEAKLFPENKHFEYFLKYREGTNVVQVTGYDANGKEVITKDSWVDVDYNAPKLKITSPTKDANGYIKPNADGMVTITGTATDDQAKPNDSKRPLSVKATGGTVAKVKADGSFSVTVKPNNGQVFVTARDGINATTEVFKLPPTAADKKYKLKITFEDPALDSGQADSEEEYNLGSQLVFLDRGNQFLTREGDKTYYTMKGQFNRKPAKFTVCTVQTDPNSCTNVTVDQYGKFEHKFEVKQGLSVIGATVVDSLPNSEPYETWWRFFWDSKTPGVKLTTTPAIADDGAIYLKDGNKVDFAGEVWDNQFGYDLAINGNVISTYTNIWDPGAKINKRTFTHTVNDVANGDYLLFGLYDKMANGLEQIIPIVVDKALDAKPEITGVQNGEVLAYKAHRTITVVAKDENLASIEVTLDGKPVKTLQTKLQKAKGASFAHLGDLDEGSSGLKPDLAEPHGTSGKPAANSDKALSREELANKAKAAQEKANAAAEAARSGEATANETGNAAAADQPRKTGEGYTALTVKLDAADMELGEHVIVAKALDKAGNAGESNVMFEIRKAPSITGPDSLTINPDDGVDSVMKKAYAATDQDGESLEVKYDVTKLQLDKAVDLVLTATDKTGITTTRTVKITLQRPLVTLTDEKTHNGSMTARFVKGDIISIVYTKDEHGNIKVEVSNTGPTVTGEIALVNVPLDQPVYRYENGKYVRVKTVVKDGKLIILGSSKSTYIIGNKGMITVVPPIFDNGTGGSRRVLDNTGVPEGTINNMMMAGMGIVLGGLCLMIRRRYVVK